MMKKLTLLSFCVLTTLQLWAQGKVELMGKFENHTADTVHFQHFKGRIGGSAYQVSAPLGEDGSFSALVEVEEPFNEVIMIYDNKYAELVVTPGQSLVMEGDAADMENTLHFSGEGAKQEDFITLHTKEMNMAGYYPRKIQQYLALPLDSFRDAISTLYAQEMAFLKAHEENLPQDFINYWKNSFKYKNNYFLVVHSSYQKRIAAKAGQTLPADFDAQSLKALPKEYNDELIGLTDYRNYVWNDFMARVALNSARGKDQQDVQRIQDSVITNAAKMMPPKTAEFAQASIINFMASNMAGERAAQLFQTFVKQHPKSMYTPYLTNMLKELNKMAAGSQAMDFEFTTTEGKTMKLSDLKGKVVYIDFWASWCRPCIGEMPYSKQLREHYKDEKNVVFLYVSIDEDAERWKMAMEKYDVQGMNTMDSGGWNGEIAKKYGIQSIPAYFLIDKQGNFATKSTPRPSNTDAVKSLIDGLLQQ